MKTVFRFFASSAALLLATISAASAPAPDLITALPPQTNGQALGASGAGGLTPDGKYALVYSSAANFGGIQTDPGAVNLYRVDTQSGAAVLVSRNVAGTGGADENILNACISADGQFVAFESDARNLDAADSDQARDIFLRDIATGATKRITAPVAPSSRHLSSSSPSMSADGRLVAFSSTATDITLGQPAGTSAPLFFLHDRVAGTNRVVFSRPLGQPALQTCSNPIITRDGKIVFFEGQGYNLATASQLVPTQVYAYLLEEKRLVWVSTNAAKMIQNIPQGTGYGDLYLQDITVDGRFCLYSMDRASIQDARHLFRHEVNLFGPEATLLVASNYIRAPDASGLRKEGVLSGDGNFVAYARTNGIIRWRADTGIRETVSLTNDLFFNSTNNVPPIMSMDGRYIAFITPLLTTNAPQRNTNTSMQVFVRDTQEQTTRLVTVGAQSGQPIDDGIIYDLSMSDDGQTLLFSSTTDGLALEDANDSLDAFSWRADASPGLKILSRGDAAPRGSDAFAAIQISTQPTSASGRWTVFSALHGANTNMQVWLRDLQAGTVLLASHAEGGTNAAAGASLNAMISANGRWIAYETHAKDIVSLDLNNRGDIVIYDRATQVSQAVSLAGLPPQYATSPSLRAFSPNGQFIVFTTSYLASPDYGAFLWDRLTGRSAPIIRDSGGFPSRGRHAGFAFSADSSRLAMTAQSQSLISFFDPATHSLATTNRSIVLLHETDGGRTLGLRLTARANAAPTYPVTLSKFSPDGSKLVTGYTNSPDRGIAVFDVNDLSSNLFKLGRYPLEISPSSQAAVVAYSFGSASSNILGVLNTATGETNLIDGTNTTRRLTLLPRGDKLIYSSYGGSPDVDTNTVPDTYIYDLAKGAKQPFVVAAGYATTFSAPTVGHILSPDSSRVLVATTAGELAAGDENFAPDLFSFSLGGVGGAPLITADPIAHVRHDGEGATFFVASSSPEDTLTYQWYFKGLALADGPGVSGADSATLRLRNLGADDAGGYYVVVSNGSGSATSATAQLEVQPIDLMIQASGGNVEISWPVTVTPFQLEVTGEFADAATVWLRAETGAPSVANERITASLPASEAAQYFRLKSAAP